MYCQMNEALDRSHHHYLEQISPNKEYCALSPYIHSVLRFSLLLDY